MQIDQCFFHCAKAFLRSNLWKPDQRYKVSFGEIHAAKIGVEPATARAYDEAVQTNYREEL